MVILMVVVVVIPVVVASGFKSVPKVLLVDFFSIYKKKHLELETYTRLELPCLPESRCPFILLQNASRGSKMGCWGSNSTQIC